MDIDYTKIRILQDELLKVYEVIRKICDKHNVHYYASGGTAIGALRHKGFIPWDDDLDLEIAREDYARLGEVLEKELPANFAYLSFRNCRYYDNLFAKVICTDENYVKELEGRLGFTLGEGLFIDLIPADYFPRSKVAQIMRIVQRVGVKIIQKAARIFGGTTSSLYRKALAMDESVISSCDYKHAAKEYYSVWFKDDWKMFTGKLNVMKEDYAEPRFVPFENTTMAVMQNVENFLTQQFGDWKTLPPESERRLYHGQEDAKIWRFGPRGAV